MSKRILLATLLCAALAGSMLFTGCSQQQNTSGKKLISTAQSTSNSTLSSAADTPKVSFNEEDTSTEYSEENATTVKLSGSSAEISGNGAALDGTTLRITAAGTYLLSGQFNDGQVLISAGKDDTVRLVLDNVSLSSSSGSAVYAEKCGKTILLLKDGTKNTVSDGSSYVSDTDEDSDAPNAAVYCKDDLTILGSGSLTVTGNARNGITGKDIVRISGGSIDVTAKHNGITGRDALAIEGGTISVTTTDGDGLRSTYSDTDKSDKGHITIGNAAITIISGSDGIQAAKNLDISSGTISITTGGGAGEVKTQQGGFGGPGGFQQKSSGSEESIKGLKAGSNITVSGGTVTVDAYDDAIHSNGDVFIKDGTLSLKSGDDGIHADTTLAVTGGNITVSQSYEGFEAIAVDISGGVIDITATDDGINEAGGNDNSGFGNFDNNMNFGGRRFRRDFNNNQSGESSDTDNQQPGNPPELPSGMPSDMQPGNPPELPSDMPSDMQPGNPPELPSGMPSDMQPGNPPELPSDMPSDMQPGNPPQNNENSQNTENKQDDDSISTALNISGGTVYVNAQGDGLDSNSALNISGGLIVVNGTTQGGNGIIDHDGTCIVTGGTLIGAGTSDMLEMPGESSTQKTAVILFDQQQAAGTLVYISDSNNHIIAAITPEKNFGCVILSCPELKDGETYKVSLGGTATGDSTHGYYSQATVSGGTQYTTFQLSGTVTYVNQNGVTTYNGGMGGMRGNRGGMRNNGTESTTAI